MAQIAVTICMAVGLILYAVVYALPYRLTPRQSAILMPCLAVAICFWVAGIAIGFIALYLARQNHTAPAGLLFTRIGMVLCALGLMFAILDPGNLGVHSTVGPRNQCLNNLRNLDNALAEWQARYQKTNEVPTNLQQLQEFLSEPVSCPEGGVYSLRDGTPKCSIASHDLQ